MQHGLHELNRSNASQAVELRRLEALRLDEMQDAVWEKAADGESEYVPVFLPWSADPRRTQEWRDRVIATSITPRLSKREYPEVVDECWTAPSGLFFELWDPARHVQDVKPVPEWHTVRCIDWGITTAACLWIQVHP